MTIDFVHLRLHTEFSLSDGLVTIPAAFEQAAKLRMPALGITDLSNLYGTVKFYKEAFKTGVKPIIGVDIKLATSSKNPAKLTLLCMNNKGYQHLLKLISKAYLEGQTTGEPFVEKVW